MTHNHRIVAAAVVVLIASGGVAQAQLSETLAWTAFVGNEYVVHPNITYLTANNWDATLDVYRSRQTTANPTLIFMHGGGWMGATKEQYLLTLLPYFAMGWTVVNVEYRLGTVSLAPAAVEDCRCALRWVYAHAKEYSIDTAKIVVSGRSAGGHLALTTGMLPDSAGLDRQCPGPENMNVAAVKVAAIINWCGITDVGDLLDGPNMKGYAVAWLGSQPNREEIARRDSPLTYVRSGLPPVITIHGDADQAVPYTHAVRLHQALSKAGVDNELVTVPGGGHGGFSREEMLRIYGAIRAFLRKHGLISKPVEK